MMPTSAETGSKTHPEPSLAELVRIVLDDAKELLRAEVDLLKADAKDTLKIAAAALIVLTASGVLLALTLSLLTAAIVLALKGSPTIALLSAALINGLVSGAAILWLRARLRKPSPPPAQPAIVVNSASSQPRSQAS
jgi:hypothetical protein